MANETVNFLIVKYVGGKFRINTPHNKYHFRDGLSKDGVKPEEVVTEMENIAKIMHDKYDCDTTFEFSYI